MKTTLGFVRIHGQTSWLATRLRPSSQLRQGCALEFSKTLRIQLFSLFSGSLADGGRRELLIDPVSFPSYKGAKVFLIRLARSKGVDFLSWRHLVWIFNCPFYFFCFQGRLPIERENLSLYKKFTISTTRCIQTHHTLYQLSRDQNALQGKNRSGPQM